MNFMIIFIIAYWDLFSLYISDSIFISSQICILVFTSEILLLYDLNSRILLLNLMI